jgi:hypothetical protein
VPVRQLLIFLLLLNNGISLECRISSGHIISDGASEMLVFCHCLLTVSHRNIVSQVVVISSALVLWCCCPCSLAIPSLLLLLIVALTPNSAAIITHHLITLPPTCTPSSRALATSLMNSSPRSCANASIHVSMLVFCSEESVGSSSCVAYCCLWRGWLVVILLRRWMV